MRIKTFQGRSLEELLPQIREELGASAVVLGQRAKVQGGIGGFFGTKVVEVTAADRMPDDDQLVDLEDQLVSGELVAAGTHTVADPEETGLADRFRGAMRMGRAGGLDVTDEWDPSQDAELASEYGRVLEHAASAGFAELDVPTASTARVVTEPISPQLDPAAQAQLLAARAHSNVEATTERIERAGSNLAGSYAPPAALPRVAGMPTTQTFAASVTDSPAIFDAPAVASQIVDPLREDLGLGPVPATLQPLTAPAQGTSSDPISAALDLIDLRAMEALRSAVDASLRIEQSNTSVVDGRPELRRELDVLAATGAEPEVVAELAHRVAHHRLPFAPGADVGMLMRDVAAELVETRTGFERTSTTHTLAVIGASSSGKTTVIAQLAHAYKASGIRVGVVCVLPDADTPISQDPRLVQLGADLRYVTTPEHAVSARESFAGHDLVLVDTPGMRTSDDRLTSHVRACFDALGVDDVHAVVPLATSTREATSAVERYRPLGANRVIISRVNETHYVGQLLNLGFSLGMPMSFLSDDARVDTGLVPASSREIVARVLPSDVDPEDLPQ